MEYKRKVTIDRNLIGILAVTAAILAAGAVCLIRFSALIGVLCLGAGLLTCRTVAKTLRRIASARILTYTDGLTVFNADGSKMSMEWNEMTHAGKVRDGKFAGHVFLYDGNADRFIQLPPIFHGFGGFETELREHVAVADVALQEGETVRDHIKSLVS